MEENFLRPDFQFEKYIADRLMEISDEGERRALKEVMRETLVPFYEQTSAYMAEIENRLEQTSKKQQGRYEVITGIARKDRIDLTEEAMVPMQYGDLADMQVDIEEMKEQLSQGNPYAVLKVFFKMSYAQIQQIEREKRTFKGIVYTQDGEYPAFFSIERNQSYLQKVQKLYDAFMQNAVSWNTVCAPYLYKFFDVKIVKTQCPADEMIQKITVDFEEYKQYAHFDLIPVWNIRMVEEKTGAYPELTIDQIHYDHCIYKGHFKEGRDYLAVNSNVKIWNLYRMDGDMHILCDAMDPVRWQLVEMGYDVRNKNIYEYPVFGNVNQQQQFNCIQTYAEVKRYISQLGYENYVELLDIKVQQEYINRNYETYGMDAFIEDEIRVSTKRPYMVFLFQAKDRECYLNQDVMSFLVSKVQWQIPEFHCVGELQ